MTWERLGSLAKKASRHLQYNSDYNEIEQRERREHQRDLADLTLEKLDMEDPRAGDSRRLRLPRFLNAPRTRDANNDDILLLLFLLGTTGGNQNPAQSGFTISPAI